MEGFTNFLTGGALGFDTLAARAVLRLKEKYKDVTLFLALPCPEQTKKWSSKDKKEYERILALADSHKYISDHFTKFCMHARNRYMVDNSACLVAFYRGGSGGTGSTVSYAEGKLPYIINLADTFE